MEYLRVAQYRFRSIEYRRFAQYGESLEYWLRSMEYLRVAQYRLRSIEYRRFAQYVVSRRG